MILSGSYHPLLLSGAVTCLLHCGIALGDAPVPPPVASSPPGPYCFVLFLGFSVAQGMAASKGLQISCGCFGGEESEKIGTASLAIAIGSASAALIGLLLTGLASHSAIRGQSGLKQASPPSAAFRTAYTLIELLVVISIVAILISILLPAVQKVRESAARLKCQNNLKQIGLGLHSYHDTMQTLPSGCSYRNGASDQPHMTWMTRLLPYLEQSALWEQAVAAFKREPFFEAGPHLPILGTVVNWYSCPSDPRSVRPSDHVQFKAGLTSYLGVGGVDYRTHDGMLYLDSNTQLTGVSDGTSQTILVGERPPNRDENLGWWYAGWGQSKDGSADSVLGAQELKVGAIYRRCPSGPYAFRAGRISDPCDAFHFWSLHPGGANFVFADGSVRFLSYSANAILPALSTRAGGESVAIPD